MNWITYKAWRVKAQRERKIQYVYWRVDLPRCQRTPRKEQEKVSGDPEKWTGGRKAWAGSSYKHLTSDSTASVRKGMQIYTTKGYTTPPPAVPTWKRLTKAGAWKRNFTAGGSVDWFTSHWEGCMVVSLLWPTDSTPRDIPSTCSPTHGRDRK